MIIIKVVMIIIMIILIIVIIIAIMMMMIKIILIIVEIMTINSLFQPGDFSTGSTTVLFLLVYNFKMENNVRNIFLPKSCRKRSRKASYRSLFVF